MTTTSLPLAHAKARLSQVVRTVRDSGQPVVITVNGQPAVEVRPIQTPMRRLTPEEVVLVRELTRSLARIPRPGEPFDAVELVREGRR